MKILSHILVLTLSIALIAAPILARPMENPNDPAYSLTICSEGGLKTIILGQDGIPLQSMHICLDCCLVTVMLVDAITLPKSVWMLETANPAELPALPKFVARRSALLARGPPALI